MTLQTKWPQHASVMTDAGLQVLTKKLLPEFNQLAKQQFINEDLHVQFKDIYLPLAAWIANKHLNAPLVFGINGAQGAGKSTLSKILKLILTNGFGKSVLIVSIDDFYLSQQRRQSLANTVHPLLKVRGVPGTHDVMLAEQLLADLVQEKLPVQLPIFDKAHDELLPDSAWRTVNEPVDIILFEGWCVGAQPQQSAELSLAINELEQHEDPTCYWRSYVNEQLGDSYQSLFEKIDYLLMMKVPDMASVFDWRLLQEQKLSQRCIEQNMQAEGIMSDSQIRQFIMHFERLTRSMLAEMPSRADIVMELNTQHQINTIHVTT